MVGGSELAVGHARALPTQQNVGLAVGDVGLDLLQGAAGEKRGGGADEGNHPTVGQPGSDADKVLFGDADVDAALRKFLAEPDQIARSDRVVTHDNDARVLIGQGDELLGERLSAVEGGGLGDGGSGHLLVNSCTACVTCSLEGTLWCHSTRFSMKDTPLPLTVLAMTATGLPVVEGVNASSSAA